MKDIGHEWSELRINGQAVPANWIGIDFARCPDRSAAASTSAL